MTMHAPSEAMPVSEHKDACSCHCHEPVYCPECNRPNGPLEDREFQEHLRGAYARIWNRVANHVPELRGICEE
jgi:hypothetical protein